MRKKSPDAKPEQHPEFYGAVQRYFRTCNRADVLERYNAIGVGLGFKVSENRTKNSLSVRVFVEEKSEKGTAPKHGEMVKPCVSLQCDSGDELKIPTDVARATLAVAHGLNFRRTRGTFDPRIAARTLIGGLEIGPIDNRRTEFGVGDGTLGGWAWDARNRRVVLLSNAHVLGSHDQGSRVVISQPSNKKRPRKIAMLSGSAGYFGTDESTVDAAIGAELDLERVDLAVNEIGPAIMATAEPELRAKVEKFGVRTAHTTGRVLNTFWMGYVNTAPIGGKPAERKLFRHCIRIHHRIRTWADHGDSGALVFAQKNLPGTDIKPVIGLHFAGEEGNSRVGFACRIHEVFEALGLTSLADGALSLVLSAIPLDETKANHARATLALLFEGVPRSRETRALRDLLTKHRAVVTALVIRDDRGDLRERIANVLRRLVGDGQSVEDVWRTPLDESLVAAIDECCDEIKRRSDSREFSDTVDALRALINAGRNHQLAYALGHRAQSSGPGIPEEPPGERPPRPTREDVVAYLDERGRTEILERFDATSAEPYRHSGDIYGILIGRERGRPLKVEVPSSIAWTRGDTTLSIPLRVMRARAAVRK